MRNKAQLQKEKEAVLEKQRIEKATEDKFTTMLKNLEVSPRKICLLRRIIHET